jgi:general stress protein YciG
VPSSDKRGLASADEETRQRVAKAGGEARARDPKSLAEAGRKGGEAVSQDREHMAEIGRKGGEASRGRGSQGSSTREKAERGEKGGI